MRLRGQAQACAHKVDTSRLARRVLHPSFEPPQTLRVHTKIWGNWRINKDKFIKIRFQDEEREELFEAAKKRGMKLSDLIRNAVCGYIGRTQTKIKPAMNIVAVPDKVIIAVNKIGTNVNQLARSVNTAIKYGENFDAIAIQATLFEVLFALYQIIESLKTERKMLND